MMCYSSGVSTQDKHLVLKQRPILRNNILFSKHYADSPIGRTRWGCFLLCGRVSSMTAPQKLAVFLICYVVLAFVTIAWIFKRI